jgi:hypothetical protein
MKLFKIILISLMALLVVSSTAMARDFSWTRDFNKQAKADLPEFRARMTTRFEISELHAIALRNIFASPADAYIMLRFGEMQGVLKKLSREEGIAAIKKYRRNKEKGWIVVAESLGVDPGSDEFLALKQGHDLYDGKSHDQVAYREHNRGNVN